MESIALAAATQPERYREPLPQLRALLDLDSYERAAFDADAVGLPPNAALLAALSW